MQQYWNFVISTIEVLPIRATVGEPSRLGGSGQHFLLPWNTPCRSVEVRFESVSYCLATTSDTTMPRNNCCFQTRSAVTIRSPSAWNDFAIRGNSISVSFSTVPEATIIFLIEHHEIVVQKHCSPHYGINRFCRCFNVLLEDSLSVGKDSESVFNSAPCSTEAVVVHPTFIIKAGARVWTHNIFLQRKCLIANKHIG